MITTNQIMKLREKTRAGVMEAKRALEESKGDMKKAEAWIAKNSIIKAEKKAGRKTKEGLICAYVHHDGKSGAMMALTCETDFVARNEEFKKLGQELAMQVCSMKPKNVNELLVQEYIRDPSKKIKDLITDAIGKIGENIKVAEFVRLDLTK